MAKKAKSKPKPASNKPALKKPAQQKSVRRETVFQSEFLEDLRFWVETERNIALKILELIEAIQRNPFSGIGKPEPLKYLAPGTWSRRITQEHRLVYLVRDDRIDFLQARYHY
jgi:toxin YoeB